uniref:MADS-box transcription factor GbMADS3 n=1 Tax=Ginkgo biloba TaxID=3311 RepID=Q58A80_GINBI|nr:MADS-box transcription factor GbMADS3 [Ginkgo biloba]
MVRGKTQMKRNENATSRQVTFSKRRNGLLKKAYEFSVLCDAEVGLIIFSPRGKLYEFASASMQKMLERYQKYSDDMNANKKTNEQDAQHWKEEIENMGQRIEILEATQRQMLGECLASCSMKELNHLENQVERGLNHIRARKTEILMEQIEQLKRKERFLTEENAILRQKCIQPHYADASISTTPTIGYGSIQHPEVETQLLMRPPEVQDHIQLKGSN